MQQTPVIAPQRFLTAAPQLPARQQTVAQAASGDSGAPEPAKKLFMGYDSFTWSKIAALGAMFFCILFNYTILRDTKVRGAAITRGQGGSCVFFDWGCRGAAESRGRIHNGPLHGHAPALQPILIKRRRYRDARGRGGGAAARAHEPKRRGRSDRGGAGSLP